MDHPPPTSETEQGVAKKAKLDPDPKAAATTTATADSGKDFTPPRSTNGGGDSNALGPAPAKKSENEQDDERMRNEASLMLSNMATHVPNPNVGVSINIPNPGTGVVFEPMAATNIAAGDKEEDPENAYNMSQSERKRHREKKRRQNISAAIDNLTKILLKVDPINFIEHNNQVYFATERGSINNSNDPTFRKRRSSTSRTPATSHHHQPLNRTEIITHAAMLIERLAAESEESKVKMIQLQHMSNNGEGNGAPAGATSTNNGAPSMSMVSPFPMQQVCQDIILKEFLGTLYFLSTIYWGT